jgi:hypothetical protein
MWLALRGPGNAVKERTLLVITGPARRAAVLSMAYARLSI